MPRVYDNSRRSEAAARTRQSILKAAAELVVESGSMEIALPAVSRRAGVSPATLFRHFTNKQELFAALAEMQRRAVSEDIAPRSVAEVQAALTTVFDRARKMEPLVRWTLGAGLATGTSRRPHEQRRGMIAAVLDGEGVTDPRERALIERLLLLLTSPLVTFYWQDYLGLDDAEAAATAAWAIGQLVPAHDWPAH